MFRLKVTENFTLNLLKVATDAPWATRSAASCSTLEGAAVSSIKIKGAPHEFCSLEGVVEDVTDIILNIKQLLFKS